MIMANVYKLPYTGSEINDKLNEIAKKAEIAMMTTAEYEALESYDANTLYMLTDNEDPEYALKSDFEALQDVVEQKSLVQLITWGADD